MLHYEKLSNEIENKIKSDIDNNARPNLAFDESNVIRRANRDTASVWRTAFIRDIDKILHCPYYNRYADKTQVFSFYKNDDITRRALHVQLVSRRCERELPPHTNHHQNILDRNIQYSALPYKNQRSIAIRSRYIS